MEHPRSGAVLYAKSLSRLQAFYRDVLGFEVESAQRDHVVLVSPALQLVIVEIPARTSASITIEEPPRLRTESPTKLIFQTPSIAEVRETARAHGGDVLPPDREWDFQGDRVCDANDPEGNVFQLRQR
jgi:predicted enzyme related to lactoylglutathione lyase